MIAYRGSEVRGTFRMWPPMLGGALDDRFDVVTHVDGGDDFGVSWQRAVRIVVSGVQLPLMRLGRVLASKRASNRPKDLAQIPALEEALAALDANGG